MFSMYIEPPEIKAVFEVNWEFLKYILLGTSIMYMAPPFPFVHLLYTKMTFSSCRPRVLSINIAPPLSVELLLWKIIFLNETF